MFGFRIGLSVLKEVKESMGMTEEYGEYKYELGACYKMGVGTPIDLEKEAVWSTKAAEQGLDGGQCALGFCYEIGKGVTKDVEKAKEWHTKAAEQ